MEFNLIEPILKNINNTDKKVINFTITILKEWDNIFEDNLKDDITYQEETYGNIKVLNIEFNKEKFTLQTSINRIIEIIKEIRDSIRKDLIVRKQLDLISNIKIDEDSDIKLDKKIIKQIMAMEDFGYIETLNNFEIPKPVLNNEEISIGGVKYSNVNNINGYMTPTNYNDDLIFNPNSGTIGNSKTIIDPLTGFEYTPMKEIEDYGDIDYSYDAEKEMEQFERDLKEKYNK